MVGHEFNVHWMSICRSGLLLLKFSGSANVLFLGFAKTLEGASHRFVFSKLEPFELEDDPAGVLHT